MATLKCKACGGELVINEDSSVCECEYCGLRQTVPTIDNEKKITLFTRANRLRLACEFDKAAGVYESIVAEFPEEAEAYWGLVLCKYGIEYVDDPGTGNKVPTCHRSSFDCVLDDSNFDMAQEYADLVARRVYRDEAIAIEKIRKGIIEVSSQEEPYDIFICYKETDENGERTLDSVIAEDIYNALTEKDYKVFFSRITLEDKLGQEYEPYIFAALNSAKIMLVVGTSYENYDAVWVKNEWSRFLKLISSGQKKYIIPCFKDVDPYDMPREFAKLQAQDMGKIGALQDLLRGIEKVIGKRKDNTEKKNEQPPAYYGGPSTQSMIKRGNLSLEDSDFSQAVKYFDQALDIDAECAQAYLGVFLAENKVPTIEVLVQKHIAQTEDVPVTTSIIPLYKNIEEEITPYIIPSYLPRERLYGVYNDYDRSYESREEERRKQLSNEEVFFAENKHWKKAVRFADKDFLKILNNGTDSIFAVMKERINSEIEIREENEEKYKEFIAQCPNKVKELYVEIVSIIKSKAMDCILRGNKVEAQKLVSLIEKEPIDNIEEYFNEKASESARFFLENGKISNAEQIIAHFTVDDDIRQLYITAKIQEITKLIGESKYYDALHRIQELPEDTPSNDKEELQLKYLHAELEEAKAGIENGDLYRVHGLVKDLRSLNWGCETEISEICDCYVTKKIGAIQPLLDAGNTKEADKLLRELEEVSPEHVQDLRQQYYDKKKEEIAEQILGGDFLTAKRELTDILDKLTEDSEKDFRKMSQEVSEELIRQKRIDEAIDLIVLMGNPELISEIYSNYGITGLNNTSCDTVFFGRYKKSTETMLPIEWINLGKIGEAFLLCTKYGIDTTAFADKDPISWEKSIVRQFLNDAFYNMAFSEEDKKYIVSVDLKSLDSYTGKVEKVQDNCFILDENEVETFLIKEKRQLTATEYAKRKGCLSNSKGHCFWWLRTYESDRGRVSQVDGDGTVKQFNGFSNNKRCVVRPCIIISLDGSIKSIPFGQGEIKVETKEKKVDRTSNVTGMVFGKSIDAKTSNASLDDNNGRRLELQSQINRLEEEKKNLQYELSQVRGFFSGRQKKQLSNRIEEVENDLKRLKGELMRL